MIETLPPVALATMPDSLPTIAPRLVDWEASKMMSPVPVCVRLIALPNDVLIVAEE